jgi:uncharacterized alkaline shock family protein YloU
MKKIDTKEFEIPETLFVRDIENKVLQGIVLQSISQIEGIGLVEGNLFDNIWGKDSLDGIKGISCTQDGKKQCVTIRVEVNIRYGLSIPLVAEEIQTKVARDVTRLTGLHVSQVHVVFKGISPLFPQKEALPAANEART